ncbi:MAG: acetolactate synthase small subunit [Candidatus Poseidoniales archaeon]|jgi:acetolactate synthase-1/3 small subunit|nr:acetolactate synthase small subunit [Dehalococcoidia bacterium]PKB82888.1 MAG: acetolactate synthase small subunit [SAR202 cluster bacterium MP-SInd-SRR3963457-G1]PKB84637.1 MAG: acetolactate synthase small subunit [SAR202 cluster bacterium MP-NPac-SRR3961935-G1]RTZ96107.1 MAG: acetolactate synthase small subunit [Candidatus Poseidoniales archaeon]RUA28933.1 MAG: acetolactate synthase small subunit [Chloroflexota bacterium]
MAQANQTEQHTLVALVEDKPGVLTKVASMFRRRGFNIASLAVGNSEQPGLSRMTFVVNGDEYTVGQVVKQLDKLIEVIEVADITSERIVTRELALLKVKTTPMNRGEIIQIVNLFRANIIDVGSDSMVIEITGEEDKINALHNLLAAFGIIEMLRTGLVAMVRGQANGMANGHDGQVNGHS